LQDLLTQSRSIQNDGVIDVRHADQDDQPAVDAFLGNHNALRVARLGEVLDASRWPALIAKEDGPRFHGTGTVLVAALDRIAVEHGWRRLWLFTTNDNVDALRIYQRRGFRFESVHVGAVDDSRRRLKSEIPEVGERGIRIHDELELDKLVG